MAGGGVRPAAGRGVARFARAARWPAAVLCAGSVLFLFAPAGGAVPPDDLQPSLTPTQTSGVPDASASMWADADGYAYDDGYDDGYGYAYGYDACCQCEPCPYTSLSPSPSPQPSVTITPTQTPSLSPSLPPSPPPPPQPSPTIVPPRTPSSSPSLSRPPSPPLLPPPTLTQPPPAVVPPSPKPPPMPPQQSKIPAAPPHLEYGGGAEASRNPLRGSETTFPAPAEQAPTIATTNPAVTPPGVPITVPPPQAALRSGRESAAGGMSTVQHRLPLLMILLVVALVPAALAAIRGRGRGPGRS